MALRLSEGARTALLAATLAGCASTTSSEPLEPEIRLVEVVRPQPVPCPALADMGAEPLYPDTDAAIAAATSFAELGYLYATGRKLRIARLAEYQAVAAACNF